MKKVFFVGLGLWFAAGSAFAQQSLTLEKYLKQVSQGGPEYQAAQAGEEGLQDQSHQMDLIYSPFLVASYSHLDDQEQQPSFLSPDQTLVDSAGASIVEKLPFGPSFSVGYAFNNINLYYSPELFSFAGTLIQKLDLSGSDLSSAFPTSYYQISPVVSLSVPLLKDFGGSQTASSVKKVQYQLESGAKMTAYQKEGILYGAKVTYWGLALAREMVEIRQDTLDRNQKIWEWTKRRVANDLADPPEALQAQASVREADLELQTAQDNERSARLAFNRFRGVDRDLVPEKLDSLEVDLTKIQASLPEKEPARLDLQAVDADTLGKKAAYDEVQQDIYPDVTAFASWRGSGLDPNFSTANENAFGTDHPTWLLGASLNLPLDLFTASRVARGYKREYEAAQLNLKGKQLEVSQDWMDILSRLDEVDKRLDMAVEIESLRKENAVEEKTRLAQGRTTQFQLLMLENAYSLSRLRRLSLLAEKLELLAKAQWYMAGAPGPLTPGPTVQGAAPQGGVK